ncbi:MAG: 3-deoxy-7-phosphoheptulonate synthase [Bdellovibrionales bacterium]
MTMMPTANKNSVPKTKPVRVGSTLIGGTCFTLIAGPCSIENKNHFELTAKTVNQMGANLIRGGIWKLRTSADSFQGLGNDAFNFIRETLKNTGLNLVSEVTDPRQIEQIHDFVDMFQIGSRNMHNYALLKEIGKTQKPVLIKRGFAALVDEWIKSTEYVRQGGNDNIVLCERGIRTFETCTRNTLDINAVIYVKERTHLPVIVDPSHGIGIRSMVPPLALAAAAAGADGIIVEVHPEPEKALSDGQQTLNFQEFESLVANLTKVLDAIGRPLQKPL